MRPNFDEKVDWSYRNRGLAVDLELAAQELGEVCPLGGRGHLEQQLIDLLRESAETRPASANGATGITDLMRVRLLRAERALERLVTICDCLDLGDLAAEAVATELLTIGWALRLQRYAFGLATTA